MAITLVNSAFVSGTNPFTLGESASPGDLIVINITASGSTNGNTLSATDNVNTGSYLTPAPAVFNADAGNNISMGMLYIAVNKSGTPAITFSWNSGVGSNSIFWAHFTGFLHTVTINSVFTTPSAGSSSTITNGPVNTNFNNELVLSGMQYFGTSNSGGAAGWSTCPDAHFQYQVVTTAGTAISISQGLSASNPWNNILFGFYDLASGSSNQIRRMNRSSSRIGTGT